MQHFERLCVSNEATYNLFFMEDKSLRHIQRTIQRVDAKCDRILGMIEVMLGSRKDSLLESIKESARDMYACSIEECRRIGKHLDILRHD